MKSREGLSEFGKAKRETTQTEPDLATYSEILTRSLRIP